MATISLRVPDDELKVFKSYAKLNKTTVSDMLRTTMIERIEDEYDLKVFADYEADRANGKLVTRPIDDLWDELGI